MYLQITRYEMTQTSCKRDSKSKSHPGMKLAPVRVFSCKHPLSKREHGRVRNILPLTHPLKEGSSAGHLSCSVPYVSAKTSLQTCDEYNCYTINKPRELNCRNVLNNTKKSCKSAWLRATTHIFEGFSIRMVQAI